MQDKVAVNENGIISVEVNYIKVTWYGYQCLPIFDGGPNKGIESSVKHRTLNAYIKCANSSN